MSLQMEMSNTLGTTENEYRESQDIISAMRDKIQLLETKNDTIIEEKESLDKQVCYTLSTSGAVPYRYKLFRYSLDRYGPACVHTCSGTVPIHLSILQTERTKLYRNSLFRNEPYKLLGLGSERIGTE